MLLPITDTQIVMICDLLIYNLGPIALFSNYKLTTSSGKHLEDNNHAHIVSLLYNLSSKTKGSDDLSIGFVRDRNRRRRELADNKIKKGIYRSRNMVKTYLDLPNIEKMLHMVLDII